MLKTLLVACALFALVPVSQAQGNLTKLDILPTGKAFNSYPQSGVSVSGVTILNQFCEFDGNWYMWAETPAHGAELHRTDGTPTGSQLAFDSIPGPLSGGPMKHFFNFTTPEFKVAAGKLFFKGNQLGDVKVLWVKTSKHAVPYILDTTANGEPFSNANNFVSLGNVLFFEGTTVSAGTELMMTDGTVAGTRVAFDRTPGPASTKVFYLYPHPSSGSVLMALGGPSGTNGDLWITDGTPGGTVLLSGPSALVNIGSFRFSSALGDSVIFAGWTAQTGNELFITDGTPGGTKLLADLNPGPGSSTPYPSDLGLFQGHLYFPAYSPQTGYELYRTDGTTLGTGFFWETVPGPMDGFAEPIGATATHLFLNANGGALIGSELFVTDGQSVTFVKDIYAGLHHSYPGDALALGGKLLFKASNGTSLSLFASDGTAGGTVTLTETPKDTAWQSIFLTPISSQQAIYRGFSPGAGEELFITDGTPAGTHVLADFNTQFTPDSSNPTHLGAIDGEQLYVEAQTEKSGRSIVRWTPADGVETIVPTGTLSAVRSDWVVQHEEITFESAQLGLQVTDGTELGTFGFGGIGLGTSQSAHVLGSDGSHTFLSGTHGIEGVEFWITDGAGAASASAVVLNPGPGGSFPREALMFNGELYFIATFGSSVDGLAKSDGTVGGTKLVVNVNQGGLSGIRNLTRVGDRLFFSADDGAHGHELWASDGTLNGTFLVADLVPGPASADPIGLTALAGDLCFFGLDSTSNKRHLWAINGSSLSGQKVMADVLDASSSSVQVLANGSVLFFVPQLGSMGGELWAFDGQVVQALADLEPGSAGADPTDLTAIGKHVFFAASSPATGREVFVTDGTPQGTHLAIDVSVGPMGSSPTELTSCLGDLFFVATDGNGDRELFRFEHPGADVLDLGMGASGARLSSTPPVLGYPMQIKIEHAPAGTIGLLGFSFPAGPGAAYMLPGHASWMDVGTFQSLGFSAAANWGVTLHVPAQPALQGAMVHLQVLSFVGAALPALGSNGLRLVLGD